VRSRAILTKGQAVAYSGERTWYASPTTSARTGWSLSRTAMLLVILWFHEGWAEAANLAELRIVQPIERGPWTYVAQPAIHISFRLAAPGDVTVEIARHLATIGGDAHGTPAGNVGQYYYVAEPKQVRTIRLGRLARGEHRATWDGLDDRGEPVVESQVYPWRELASMDEKPDPMPPLQRAAPVERFRIIVRCGAEELAANFERAGQTVRANHRLGPFQNAVSDPQGRFLVADRRKWRGHAFSPSWRLELTFPRQPRGHISNPVHCRDVQIDRRGNVYLRAASGIYRYDPEGRPAAWEADEPYIFQPYPIGIRNVLGVTFREDGKGEEKIRGRTVSAADYVGKPGFSYGFGGFAIDEHDEVYLFQNRPAAEIQVFDIAGRHRRTLPVPPGLGNSESMRATPYGLWVAGQNRLVRLDPRTGDVQITRARLQGSLHVGGDGKLYVFDAQIRRLDPETSESIPFSAQGPHVIEGGKALSIGPPQGAPNDAAGFAPALHGIAVDRAGRIFVSVSENRRYWQSRNFRLLEFDPEGRFVPLGISADLEQHRPGNVFVDQEPARFELFVNHLEGPPTITAEWQATDFDGKQIRGSTSYRLAERARQVLPLVIDVPEYGAYELHVNLRQEDRVMAALATRWARLRARPLGTGPDSPFAVNWGCNFYLMALAGVKDGGTASNWWHKIEPIEGVRLAYPDDAIQWSQGLEGHRRYADRWGVLIPEGFAYGEPWQGEGPSHRIYRYDLFYRYSLGVLDRFAKSHVPYYDFWNEPNFFWNVPGPFRSEHFALVGKHCWSMVKARDKAKMCVMDGDAGGTGIMRDLVASEANLYNDTIQIHYPGVRPLRFDQMAYDDLPEGKIEMLQELIRLRDTHFPGKPVWNTEEGWHGAKVKTPAVGATVIPRIYLTQIAAGADKIWWYEMGRGGQDEPTNLLAQDNVPFPAYVSYATMTRHLEGAEYLGRVELGRGNYGLLFQQPGGKAVLAAWTIEGLREVRVAGESDGAEVYDLMDRRSEARAVDGGLVLELSPQVRYVIMRRTAWATRIAMEELGRRLAALDLSAAGQLDEAVAAAAEKAHAGTAAMNRLFYLLQAAKHAGLAGAAAASADATPVRQARQTIEEKEGPDGYLRQARIMLYWAERLSRAAAAHQGEAAGGLAWAAAKAALATRTIARQEPVLYPGVVVNAYLEPKEIREKTGPKEPLDEQFRFQIEKSPGDAFDIELTVWNYYRHVINGAVSPRLPAGWTVMPEQDSYAIPPGEFHRRVFRVTIPGSAAPGEFEVGGQTEYQRTLVPEIHRQRVRIR